MDFSYYNKDNELIKFNLQVGTKWDDLNIKNDSLNSIFSKVDDGDGEITDQKELNLLEKLLNKADGIVTSIKNNVLDNDELEEIVKQIDEGKITLSKKSYKVDNNERQFKEMVTHGREHFSRQENEDIESGKSDIETVRQKYIEKIKADLKKYNHYDERFPEDRYEIEVKYNGRYYESFVYDKVSKTLSQSINIIREDGIDLELKDNFDGDILDNQESYAEIKNKGTSGTFTIIGSDGKSHEIKFDLQDMHGSDILDCRNSLKQISEYLATIPKDDIDRLIENNVKEITFSHDLYWFNEESINKNKRADGSVVVINKGWEEYGEANTAEIVFEGFKPSKREYKDLSFTRDDGYKFDIKDNGENVSTVTITSPDGKSFQLDVEGEDYDTYHQWQLPRLKNMLNNLPTQVLEDLSNEITKIKLLPKRPENGLYIPGTNAITYTAGYEYDRPDMSFVHELGHAIDNIDGTMWSKNPNFTNKFYRLKELVNKLGINNANHALVMAEEFFASTYAYLELPNDNGYANHIKGLDLKILKFKDSENPDERECYELFQSLKDDVKIRVEETRKESKSKRANNTIPNIVRTELKDIINDIEEIMNESFANFAGESLELDLISTLSADDEAFEKGMKYYEKFAKNELTIGVFDEHIDLEEEIQQLFGELVNKLNDIRTRIKAN